MSIPAPFGRLITAMVTPFNSDLSIDWAGVEKLAAHLQNTGHDGIVVNGTTGEAPTTSDDEKVEIIKAVRRATGGKVKVIAGAGNNETSHSIEQAEMAAKAGADGFVDVGHFVRLKLAAFNQLQAEGLEQCLITLVERCDGVFALLAPVDGDAGAAAAV